MKVGDIFTVLPTNGFEKRWWGSFAILEEIQHHTLSGGRTLTLYQLRTHKRNGYGEELVHTTWLFNDFELKEFFKEVT